MVRRVGLVLALAAALGACSDAAPIAALPAQERVVTESGAARLDLRFACGETECAAWLYLPKTQEPPPVVIVANGFAGTRDVALPFFAERFASAGLAALVFDYRHFGASGGAPRQLVNPWRQLEDWKSATAFARARSDVNGKRVALWGTSLSGGLVLISAASNPSVSAVVAQVPQIDAAAEAEATFPGYWWLTRLLLAGWADLAGSAFSDQASTIAAIAPSDGFGMLCDDAAFKSVEALVGKDSLYRNEVAARSIFTFDDYNPAVMAASLEAPTLLIASRKDRFAAFSAVEAFAASHPNARLEEIDGDHFDTYASPRRERAADVAVAFLVEHLKP